MQKTLIDWVKNPDGTQGYTWNPITGCLNGCEYCYARKLAHGRLKERYLANKNRATKWIQNAECLDLGIKDPFYPRFWEERLWKPRYHRKEAGIFVCDMSDLFGIGIPEEWTRKVLRVCRLCSWHRFYLLTKQPQNLIKFSPFPDNCWVGVTATNFEMYGYALLHLSMIKAKVKYISFEPLLDRIQSEYIGGYNAKFFEVDLKNHINWVIIGAQTKPMVYPKDEWVQEIEQAADNAGIPVFEKNNLYPSGFHHLLKQEVPNVTR